MSAFKAFAMIGVAVVISTAVYSAHFVGEQIEYLHQKLSPSTRDLNLETAWPLTKASLPKLEDQLSDSLQKNSPLTLTNPSTDKAVIHLSR